MEWPARNSSIRNTFLNLSPNIRTKLSPHEIIYGKTFTNNLIDRYIEDNIDMKEELDSYCYWIETIRNKMREIIINERNKEIYIIKSIVNPRNFEIGDIVMKWKLGATKGHKLEPNWFGPFTIIKKTNKGGYWLKDWDNMIWSLDIKDIKSM